MKQKTITIITLLLLSLISFTAYAHGVDDETQSFLKNNKGVAFGPFLYIGAKHMITGYDHLLFLVGVIFFLYKTKDIITYVSYLPLDIALHSYLV